MGKRTSFLLVSVAMLVALTGCQSKKEAVQLACDSPNRVDSSLPPDARGQALAVFIEQNVKNDEVIGLLGSDQPRTAKAERLDAMAKSEGVDPCELAKLWALAPVPRMWAMPPRSAMPMMSAMPIMSAFRPVGSAGDPPTRAEVRGALELGKIEAAIKGRSEAISDCYKAGIRRNRKLEGQVIVRFVIDPTGKVKSAKDAASPLPDAEVVKCIVDVIAKTSFPKPDEGEAVVTYPLTLKLGT